MQKHEGSRHLASAERGRRPRWTPTETDKALLETIFVADSFPTFSVRKQLAEQLNVDSRQVQIWFQNRRQRERVRQGAAAREAEAAESGDQEDCSPVRETKSAAPLAAPIPAEFTASGESDLAGGGESSSASTSSEVGPAAHFSPTVGPSEAPATLSLDLTAAAAGAAPSAVLRIEQLTDGRRVVHMAAGRVVEVPAEAPGALVQMLESASGARAVQAAARSLLRSQPLLMHPQAPCHDLLMQLASMEPPAAAGAGAPLGAASAAAARGGMAAAVGGGVSPRARASAASREAVDALFALGSNRA